MASCSAGRVRKSQPSDNNADLLLHPELLSRDFIHLVLGDRNITTRDDESRDRLTELYLRHVIPLPQRALPDSRWGRRMTRTRVRQSPAPGERSHGSSHHDQNRKRPLIVFDGSSSHTGPVRVKKPEGGGDRLRPPPSMSLSNPVRKLSSSSSPPPSSSSSSSSSSTPASIHKISAGNGSLAPPSLMSLKREADGSGAGLKSPEMKKKIQHVTWP